MTQRALVWKGACGIRPLGKGIPSRPATPVVRPSRKMSQWKPAGLRRGNSVPWAIKEETGGERVSGGTWGVKSGLTIMVEVEKDG